MTPPGQRDYSAVHLSRHAVERFVERFSAEPDAAAGELRRALARTRRLGRNPESGAIAVLPGAAAPDGGARSCIEQRSGRKRDPKMHRYESL